MTFTLRETIGGLNHLRFKWQRHFLGQPTDFYVEKLKQNSSPFAPPYVLMIENSATAKICDICGFAIATLSLPHGWMLEACSAERMPGILGNRKFEEWANELQN